MLLSTIVMYKGFLVDFGKYIETMPEYAHLLLSPRVAVAPREEWASQAAKKSNPCLIFKKTPCSIDWWKFDVQIFKRWLIQKQKKPKPNGKYPSWRRNMKSTCAVTWAFSHANTISLNRIDVRRFRRGRLARPNNIRW